MKWGLWSTTAASNSSTPPDGWPEGQLPSTVNDCAREMMAQIRTGIQDVQFIDLGVTPTQTGNTTFTMAGNQMQWYAYGTRVKANVGGTLMYGTVISSTFSTNTGITLRFDAGQGPLTGSLSAVSTGFPSPANHALPEIVFRQKNHLINGSYDIWQRGYGPYSLSSGNQVSGAPDAWKLTLGVASNGATLAVSFAERSANAGNVPTLAQAGVWFDGSLRLSMNAAVSGLTATDFVVLEHDIEGYDFRQIAGKPTTLSFWINSTLTGTYAISLANNAGTQSMVQNFSISAATTWERKTITFLEHPIASTTGWDVSTGAGLRVRLALAAGSTYQVGAGNWTATNGLCTSSNVNFVGGTGRTLMTVGWQLEEGTQSNILEPMSLEQEYAKCRRRLYVMAGNTPRFFGHAIGGGQAVYNCFVDTVLRTANPSISVVAAMSQWVITTGTAGQISVSAIGALNSTNQTFSLIVASVGGVGLTAGDGSMLFTSGAPAVAIVFKSEII